MVKGTEGVEICYGDFERDETPGDLSCYSSGVIAAAGRSLKLSCTGAGEDAREHSSTARSLSLSQPWKHSSSTYVYCTSLIH
jgi:hypothetical protein